MAKLHDFFRRMRDTGASDLHMLSGMPPKFRIHGELEPIPGELPITEEALKEMLFEIVDAADREKFEQSHDLDFAYSVEGVARFRCNYLQQTTGTGAVFRIIPEKIKTIAELNLPRVLERLSQLQNGLVLVTGPTGSGKSTTLAAIVDHINSTQQKHILTIEDPIEFVHHSKKCIVTQREIGHDARSFSRALRAASREDADVILIGEMRDLETISLAITLSEMGQLVFGTLHTNSAAKTIDRIIDVFPPEQQSQVRIMLSDSLKGIIAQQLLRTRDGKGRAAVLEILFGSPALSNIIREGKTQQILSVIQAGKSEGMQSLDAALMDFVARKMISPQDAYTKAQDKKAFDVFLKSGTNV